MASASRAHLIIEGIVQGVFFRAFTRDVAFFLGLKGWVRNLPDGGVEALFEGEREKIEEAIRKCSQGPPAGKVVNIDVAWEEYKNEFDTFAIRY